MRDKQAIEDRDVVFFCAVLRADALERKYPGGLRAFIADEGGVVESNLVLLSTMAQNEMNDWLDRMQDMHDLLVGEDIALGEQFHGEIQPCPGVLFIAPTRPLGRWRVRFEPLTDWTVAYAVFSTYQCVESGEIQSPGETMALFETQSLALAHARVKEEDLLRRARNECEVARAMDGAFSPYIVWVWVVLLDRAPAPGEDILDRIRPLLEATEEGRIQMLELTLHFNGVEFGRDSEQPYSLNEVLDDLAESLD